MLNQRRLALTLMNINAISPFSTISNIKWEWSTSETINTTTIINLVEQNI